jgi:hypothetical protein
LRRWAGPGAAKRRRLLVAPVSQGSRCGVGPTHKPLVASSLLRFHKGIGAALGRLKHLSRRLPPRGPGSTRESVRRRADPGAMAHERRRNHDGRDQDQRQQRAAHRPGQRTGNTNPEDGAASWLSMQAAASSASPPPRWRQQHEQRQHGSTGAGGTSSGGTSSGGTSSGITSGSSKSGGGTGGGGTSSGGTSSGGTGSGGTSGSNTSGSSTSGSKSGGSTSSSGSASSGGRLRLPPSSHVSTRDSVRRRVRSSVAGCPLHRTFPHGIRCGVGCGPAWPAAPFTARFHKGFGAASGAALTN